MFNKKKSKKFFLHVESTRNISKARPRTKEVAYYPYPEEFLLLNNPQVRARNLSYLYEIMLFHLLTARKRKKSADTGRAGRSRGRACNG